MVRGGVGEGDGVGSRERVRHLARIDSKQAFLHQWGPAWPR